jgi:IS1 family transposase
VESIPGKVSGAWVLRGTRTPVKVLFENLEAGMSIEEVIEQFPVTVSSWKASWRLWRVPSKTPRVTGHNYSLRDILFTLNNLQKNTARKLPPRPLQLR